MGRSGLDSEVTLSEYKVLIPLDGSRLAEHALAFLPALSHFGELQVTLVSVVDFADDLLEAVATEEQEREDNLLSTYLREVAADLEKHLGARVQTKTLHGAAATRILEQATESSPDLLVISTHGRSGIARWQRGAVADKVIRGTLGSVLIVGPRAMEQGQWLEAETVPPFKHILVPLDGSETAEKALPRAAEYAEHFGSTIHLFQVMPYVPLASGFWDTPVELTEDVLEAGRDYLNGLAAKLAKPGQVTTAASIGAPAQEIEDYIEANGIDLIVMTSHGRSGLARATLGSVTDRVIGAGPPVLVVRST
jgi:nucleotide-binding universal stress UspA family protein